MVLPVPGASQQAPSPENLRAEVLRLLCPPSENFTQDDFFERFSLVHPIFAEAVKKGMSDRDELEKAGKQRPPIPPVRSFTLDRYDEDDNYPDFSQMIEIARIREGYGMEGTEKQPPRKKAEKFPKNPKMDPLCAAVNGPEVNDPCYFAPSTFGERRAFKRTIDMDMDTSEKTVFEASKMTIEELHRKNLQIQSLEKQLEGKHGLEKLLKYKDTKLEELRKKLEIRTAESHELCQFYLQRSKEFEIAKETWKQLEKSKDAEIEEVERLLDEKEDEIDVLKELGKQEVVKHQKELNLKDVELQKAQETHESEIQKRDSQIFELQRQLAEFRRRRHESKESDDSFERVEESEADSESGWSNVGDVGDEN